MATLIKDHSKKELWYVNANGSRIWNVEAGSSKIAPSAVGIQTSLRDGDGNGGVPSGIPSERAELQEKGRTGSYKQWIWYRWIEKLNNLPYYTSRWHIWLQWHMGSGGSQPPLSLELMGNDRVLNLSGGGSTPNYLWRGPALVGQEVEMRLAVKWANDSTGGIMLFRGGQKVLDRQNIRTTGENAVPYGKLGFYRNASVSGTSDGIIWDLKAYDGDPGSYGAAPPTDPPAETDAQKIARLAAELAAARTDLNNTKNLLVVANADLAAMGVNLNDVKDDLAVAEEQRDQYRERIEAEITEDEAVLQALAQMRGRIKTLAASKVAQKFPTHQKYLNELLAATDRAIEREQEGI